VWYSGNKGDLWVEYKFLPQIPQTAIVDPLKLLSVLQHNWLRQRHEEGRNVAVIIGCEKVGGVILRDQEWAKKFSAAQFRDRLVPRKEIAQWIVEETSEVVSNGEVPIHRNESRGAYLPVSDDHGSDSGTRRRSRTRSPR
jgi:hypothetical protein